MPFIPDNEWPPRLLTGLGLKIFLFKNLKMSVSRAKQYPFNQKSGGNEMKTMYYFLILVSVLLVAGCGNSENPTETEEMPARILILEDGGTEASIQTILVSAGIEVVMAGPYWLYDGSNIDQFDVVIFLNGVEWTFVMLDNVQEIIRGFVNIGGVLFSTEWIGWSGATNQIINDMLPVVYGGTRSTGAETYTKEMIHPISTSLPDTFMVSNDWSFSVTYLDTTAAKQAQLILKGSRSAAAVAVGKFAEGTIIHWNMGGQWFGDDIWTSEISQLLINIVNFASDSVNK
jgi:hypothetical protein